MSVVSGQPIIRFNLAGPNGMEGLSYVEKNALVRVAIDATPTTTDIMTMPAGSVLNEVVAYVSEAASSTTNCKVGLGLDSDTDKFITTALDMSTVGNFQKYTTGWPMAAADVLTVQWSGTPAAAEVLFLISWFEMDAMADQGVHFDL